MCPEVQHGVGKSPLPRVPLPGVRRRQPAPAGGSATTGWKWPYSTRGVRALLARYATAAGSQNPSPPNQLRHFLLPPSLKTQGVDDALIQPYSGHASRQFPRGLQPPPPSPTPNTATTKRSPSSPCNHLAAGVTVREDWALTHSVVEPRGGRIWTSGDPRYRAPRSGYPASGPVATRPKFRDL